MAKPRITRAKFANVVCRFGEKFVLLDFVEEIIYPAFTNQDLQRTYSDTSYRFWDVGLAEVPVAEHELPLVAVYGRHIKKMVLKSEQDFSPTTGIVTSKRELPSAPSAFFVLILNNHKLIYVDETDDAPSITAFQATLQHNVSQMYRQYIDILYSSFRGTDAAKTKKQLYLETPHPTVEVRPLATQASIETFLKAFAIVRQVDFKFLDTNQEFPQLETHRQIREMKRRFEAKSTTLAFGSKNGLDRVELAGQIHNAAAAGNETVRVYGKSVEGADLKGNNEDFSVSLPVDNLPEDEAQRAAQLARTYQDSVQSGILIEDVREDSARKIRNFIDRIRNRHG